MLLFLTYHRVLAKPHRNPQFYDVPAAALERQLQMLHGSGFNPLTPEQLIAGDVPRKPSFILSFDDGTEDHFEVVLPLLLNYKCRGIFFAPTASLDRPGYLKNEDLTGMSRRAQYIGLHSHEHRRMDRMAAPEIREQMRLSHDCIQKLTGSRSVLFAPPGGLITPEVRQIALDSGVRLIRTMRWGYNRKPDLANLQCVPINSRTTEEQFRRIMQFRNISFTYALKQILKNILPARAYHTLRERLSRN